MRKKTPSQEVLKSYEVSSNEVFEDWTELGRHDPDDVSTAQPGSSRRERMATAAFSCCLQTAIYSLGTRRCKAETDVVISR